MRISLLTICLISSFFLSAQTFNWDKKETPKDQSASDFVFETQGLANIYPDYYENTPTALGEVFHQNLLSAGHKKLPLGTIVKVTRMDTGVSTIVRINDRGAYCDGCVIDLSMAAAHKIDLGSNSRTMVRLTVVDPNSSAVSSTNLTSKGGTTTEPFAYKESAENSPSKNTTYSPYGDIDQATVQTRGIAETNQKQNLDGVSIIEFPISPYSVQLGSYNQCVNAEKHIKSLKEKGFNNIFLLKEARTDNSVLNRVIVAPFSSLHEAEHYVNDLQQIHQMKGLVFQTKLMETDHD